MSQFIACRQCGETVNRFLESCPYCGADPGGERGGAAPTVAVPEAVAPERFRSLAAVATFLQLLFGLFVLGSVVAALVGWSYRGVLLDLDGGRPMSSTDVLVEDRYLAANFVLALVNIVLIVAWLVWFWRAYSNLTAVGRSRKRKPGWAIGSWFIPIANIVIPYRIGAELVRESRPHGAAEDAHPEPVISWWALFLLMGLVNQIAFFAGADAGDDPGALAGVVGLELIAGVLAIAASVAAIRLVRLVSEAQEQLARTDAEF